MPRKAAPICGNPLYLQWIKEMMEEAGGVSNSKMYYAYKKAYDSMSKYPVPFNHPCEASILKGVGPKITKRLEERLRQYCADTGQAVPIRSDILKRAARPPPPPPPSSPPQPLPATPTKRTYVPQYRSGAYAILLTLFMAYGNGPYRASLTKPEIIRDATQFCDTSFDVPVAKTRNYTAWNGMKTLLEKDYVYKNGSPPRYKLTEAGLVIASRLVEAAKKQGKELGPLAEKELVVTTVRISLGANAEADDASREVSVVSSFDRGAGSLAASLAKTVFPTRTVSPPGSLWESSANYADCGSLNHSVVPAPLLSYKASLSAKSTAVTSSPTVDPMVEQPGTLKSTADLFAHSVEPMIWQSAPLKQKATLSLPTVDPIIWQPGTFEVHIVLDTREIRQRQDRTYIQEKLEERGMTVSVRSLELGDVVWVARQKDSNSGDIVLDYILERKRMDDLVSSIKDGRFKEQKFRLHRGGVGQVIYLVEEFGREDAIEFGMQAVQTAISSTQVVDGFFLKLTTNVDQTIEYLVSITKMLKKLYESAPLYIIPDSCLQYQTYLPLKTHLKELYPTRTYHISFLAYNELNSKSRNLTLRDVFAKMLMCTKGFSGDKAAEIIKRYSTPHSFYTALEKCQNNEARWKMISEECGNTFGVKKIGPVLSERIAKLWFEKKYADGE